MYCQNLRGDAISILIFSAPETHFQTPVGNSEKKTKIMFDHKHPVLLRGMSAVVEARAAPID
jgi:hypothetical protein